MSPAARKNSGRRSTAQRRPTLTYPSRKAAPVKRKPCPAKCGAYVDEFTEAHGRTVWLDATPPSVDIDLMTVVERLYEYHGPNVGWCSKTLPIRGWRELRLIHVCRFPAVSTKRGNS